jgi:hypothetical protein
MGVNVFDIKMLVKCSAIEIFFKPWTEKNILDNSY